MTQLVQRAASDWLSLRRPADEAARSASLDAITLLNHHLLERLRPDAAIDVVDLGAGTGANMAWLAGRLPAPQRWTLIDRDEDLLGLVPQVPASAHVADVRRLAVDLEDLRSHYDSERVPDLVTCSAFLDVLTLRQVRDLCAFVVQTGAAALFSLSVNGTVRISPELEQDSVITATFNEHQRRHGLAGPSATHVAADTLRSDGCTVHVVETPWTLRSEDAPLVERYVSERVAAVSEQDAGLADAAHEWLSVRLAQLRAGTLTLEVGHLDLLALPPSA
ncbi:MAG: class I SAM-dependent methyltransferase [Propionibacteriaceae bacterium]|nr:class I SAM-dependent methyltransferase [Propionibacteriaceae bacterium]